MNTTACNPASLDSLRNIGPRLLPALITVFLDDTPSVLTGLRAAAAANDLWTLRMLKHRLKGSSGIFGADTLVALCDSCERDTDLTTWLETVEAEYTRVAAELVQVAA